MAGKKSSREDKKNKESVEGKSLIKDISKDYQGKPQLPGAVANLPEDSKKKMEETRKKLNEFKDKVIKKYPFTIAMGIIPPQAADKFDEEAGLTKEDKKNKPLHLLIIVPEKKYKEIGKIKTELIKEVKDMKPKVWLNIITPVDLWNFCLDSKYDIAEAIGMAFPLHDKGILGSLRVAQVHKSLCLRKFEKYIASYVIAGSLVRGTATKSSDVDVFVVIDDTDVKRMPRVELKEKLRSIIYQYIMEAGELAGVKNKLNVQVYLLTDFWESVKDASPVIFTFIRDGVPLYDRGTFLPWKLLLKMGRVKPSQESIDMFMSMGDKVQKTAKRKLMDIVLGDIYWGTVTPSQALLMLYGLPPPNTYETVEQMKKIFYEKEKMLEKKYVDILEKIAIKYYKGYEHEKVKEVSGKEVDELLKDFEDYVKRLKELRKEIEKRAQEKTIEEIHQSIFKVLEGLFGKKSRKDLISEFEKELVNKGRIEPRFLKILKELEDAKKKYSSKKKPSKREVEDIRKNSTQLMNNLIEYGQRCELVELQKSKVVIKYKNNKKADLFLTNPVFIVYNNQIKKIQDKKIQDTTQQEFEQVMKQQKGKSGELNQETLSVLKKELGKFKIVF
jgi:predicted nucleotidyltransferase